MTIRKSILILVIVAVCLCSYFNSLFGDFVWDDNVFITPNPYMKSVRFLPKFFIQDFWKIGIKSVISEYYRPLLAASFMLDYTLWGDNPFGYHLTNVIFHTLASVLIFLFIQLLLKDRLISFCSALLFSVHPIHTEAVSFISGRVDSVPLVFFLASLVLFLKYTHSKKLFFYPLSLFCFAVSLLTKEMAVTLPLIIIAIDYLFLSKRNAKGVFKNFLHLHLSFFIVLGIYLAVRYYVVGLPFGIEGGERYVRNFSLGITPFWRVFTVLKIFTLYIRLLFFPYGLKAEYLFPASDSFFDPVVLTGFTLLVLFIYLILKNTKRFPIVSFSITWFFITALPISNIIPQGNIFAERYMYMPSVGFCIGMGFLFSWLLKKDIKTSFFPWRKSIAFVSILLIVALGRVTYERNKVWKNDFVLWYDTVEATPNSPLAHANLASAYLNINLLVPAEEEIRKTIELNPYDYQFLNILGHINLKKGLHDEAIKAFKIATDLGPDYAETYHNLATAYGLKGDYGKAIKAGLTALERNPYLDDARYNLALSYKKSGLVNEAIQMYEEYLDTNPIYIGVHLDVGYLYYERGDYQRAKEHWLAALEISPDYQPAKEALKLLEE